MTGLSSVQSVRVVEPSLQTSKSVIVPRSPVGAGDVVTYTIFVTNTGTATAFDLMVTDALPSGVNFVEPFTLTWSSTDTSTYDYVDGNVDGDVDDYDLRCSHPRQA